MDDTGHNPDRHTRPLALGQVESEMKRSRPDIDFFLVGQAHYGEPGFAFIEVHGVEDEDVRHRIREEAGERLGDFGFPVDLIDGKDVFRITAIVPD